MNTVGNNPHYHLHYLYQEPDRIVALQTILSSVVKPGMHVLDVGTGALGILAVLSAKLGATRVVGIDTEDVDTALAIAKENAVAIELIQGNVVDFVDTKFDIIVGMIYSTELWYNESQFRTFSDCVSRFRKSHTVVVPNQIYYTAQAVGFDFLHEVATVESLTGLSFSFLRNTNSIFNKSLLHEHHDRVIEPMSANKQIVSVNYDTDNIDVPKKFELSMMRNGVVTGIDWTISIQFNSTVIRTATIRSKLTAPYKVNAGETVRFEQSPSWHENGVVIAG